jgi:hypothetical protein
MNTHVWITRVIMGLISLFQATSLRERYYTAVNRIEILETAIEDIERIGASCVTSSERHRLINNICDRVKSK